MAGRTIKLNSVFECPRVGYGTYQAKDATTLKAGVKAAIEAGYRHIDTAAAYANEHIIGEALQELYDAGKIKREDLFLTTKCFSTHFKPDVLVEMLKKELDALRTPYVDLYLLHFPAALQPPEPGSKFPAKFGADGKVCLDLETSLEDTWRAMEKCVELGLTRSIGISNFNINQTARMLKMKIPPAMNQVECHPVFQNKKLIDFCQHNGIVVTAYSCFGSPGTINQFTGKLFIPVDMLNDERIVGIGKKYGKSGAHVILRYFIQRNIVVIPKSLTPSRIADNFNVWDFQLSDEDMQVIGSIDQNKRFSDFPVPGIKEHPEYPHLEEGSC